jgi:hypothetical protein
MMDVLEHSVRFQLSRIVRVWRVQQVLHSQQDLYRPSHQFLVRRESGEEDAPA